MEENEFNKYIEAIKNGNVNEFLKNAKQEYVNKIHNDGLRAIHFAVSNGRLNIIKILLDNKCDIEATDNVGMRAIHFVAINGHVDCLKILINNKCEIEATVKEVLKKGKIKDVMKVLQDYPLSYIVNYENKFTVLDVLLTRNDKDILETLKKNEVSTKDLKEFEEIKEKDILPHTYQMIKECLLFRCIHREKVLAFEQFCTSDIVNKDSLFMGPSLLETLTEYNRITFIKLILSKLVKVDEIWSRAKNMAQIKGYSKISSMLLARETYLDLLYKDGYNRLHIAVFDNDPEFIAFILENKLVKENEEQQNVGTPFSLAIFMKYIECIKVFEEKKVNVNTLDGKKRSPLHIAMDTGMENYCEYIIENIKEVDAKDYIGLTFIERAVLRGHENICKMLLEKGAKHDMKINFDQRKIDINTEDFGMILRNTPHWPLTNNETIYTLCFKVHKNVYPVLLDTIDEHTVDLTDGCGNTLLHLCSIFFKVDICTQLILKSANINYENECKRTPLFELLTQNYNTNKNKVPKDMLETMNVLIEGGADLNGKDLKGYTIFDIATKYNNEKLLLTFIRSKIFPKIIEKTQWLIWLNYKYYAFVKEIIQLIDEFLLTQLITKESIKSCLEDKEIILAKAMYDKASSNVQKGVMERMLLEVSLAGDITLFKELIECDIPFEMSLDEEESFMNYAIKEKISDYIYLILYSKHGEMLLEKEGSMRKLPLHVCIECEYWDIIDQLITETKSVNKEDDNGNTPLSLLLSKRSETDDGKLIHKLMEYVRKLILKSADINKVNKLNKSVISYCTKKHLKIRVESFFQETLNQRGSVGSTVISSLPYNELVEETGFVGATMIHTRNVSSSINASNHPDNSHMNPSSYDSNSLDLMSVPQDDD